jgi:hypothetical protein
MIFAQTDTDIGCIPESYSHHDIHFTNYTPIKQRPYNTPQAKEVQVDDALSKMLKMNVYQVFKNNETLSYHDEIKIGLRAIFQKTGIFFIFNILFFNPLIHFLLNAPNLSFPKL